MSSLYLLKEAGALLASGATAGAFLGSDASPPFMPVLPWDMRTRNTYPPFAPPPIMTRIPPGTPAPPSAYGEAGMLTEARGLDESAGSPPPPGSGITQAQWDAMPQATQQGTISELAARGALTPAQAFAAQASVLTPSQQAAVGAALGAAGGCPPGMINIGGGEFPNHCVPAPSPNQVPSALPPPQFPQPPPPAMLTLRRALPPAVSVSPPALPPPIARPSPLPPMPTYDTSPTPGGGGGGGGGLPWGAIAAGGAVLAFLYAGREKKKRRRH